MIAVIVWLAAGAGAQEWTRFRGPNGSGVGKAENLPVKWTEKDYNWRVTLPGIGHSSPVLWGDRIFITSGDRKTAQRSVLCLKTSDGSVLWQRDYPSKPYSMNDANSYASSTPAVDGEGVYVLFGTPQEVTLLALTHEGKDLWQRNLGPNKGEHGGGTSPIVFEELVILSGCPGDYKCSFLAVNRKTGKTVWEIERHDDAVDYRASYATPFVYQPEGGSPQIVFSDNWSRGLTSVDPKTSQVLWQARNALPGRCVGSPILASGLIVAACGGTEAPVQAVAVAPPALKTAEAKGADAKGAEARIVEAKVAWTCTKATPYVPTPIAKGDLVLSLSATVSTACRARATSSSSRRRTNSSFWAATRSASRATRRPLLPAAFSICAPFPTSFRSAVKNSRKPAPYRRRDFDRTDPPEAFGPPRPPRPPCPPAPPVLLIRSAVGNPRWECGIKWHWRHSLLGGARRRRHNLFRHPLREGWA
ncbi:MAG: PQQ-binding-like beta-propeller repeat protein [Candidatus Sumerlaeota bacterium]|nr:PQQ-binding-like beta-propeller repeat protein [Candidatus Sumerlaeota bacterium]